VNMSFGYSRMCSKKSGPGGCSHDAKHVVFRFTVCFASRLRTVGEKYL
jgi:hypothetical protein